MASLSNPNPPFLWNLRSGLSNTKTKTQLFLSCASSSSSSPNPSSSSSSSSGASTHSQNADLPLVFPKKKKKPFLSKPKRGGFLANKGERKPLEDPAFPPGNGLLVPELIPVAHSLLEAREMLLCLLHKLIAIVPVRACRYCAEVHVGGMGHELATCEGSGSDTRRSRHVWVQGHVDDIFPEPEAYHSYDRFGLIRHGDRLGVKRLPALVELCIQAGVDYEPLAYPTLRRARPLRASGARITEPGQLLPEFQREIEKLFVFFDADPAAECHNLCSDRRSEDLGDASSSSSASRFATECHNLRRDWRSESLGDASFSSSGDEDVCAAAEKALRVWKMARSMASLLMERYAVRVCGYCPEVHIGPRGHKVRLCGAFKHQWRQGQHGWQMAGIDDLLPPRYVWHVPDPSNPRLANVMKRFYGKAPAVVELCVQAGASPPDEYKPMMRFDVAVPARSEVDDAV